MYIDVNIQEVGSRSNPWAHASITSARDLPDDVATKTCGHSYLTTSTTEGAVTSKNKHEDGGRSSNYNASEQRKGVHTSSLSTTTRPEPSPSSLHSVVAFVPLPPTSSDELVDRRFGTKDNNVAIVAEHEANISQAMLSCKASKSKIKFIASHVMLPFHASKRKIKSVAFPAMLSCNASESKTKSIASHVMLPFHVSKNKVKSIVFPAQQLPSSSPHELSSPPSPSSLLSSSSSWPLAQS